MTKKYDFKKAKQIINDYKEDLKAASLGMGEDWGWTAYTIWENGKYTTKLNKDTLIAGINDSCWATPVLQLELGDGTLKDFDCYTDDGKPTDTERKSMVQTTGQGCLTSNSNIR